MNDWIEEAVQKIKENPQDIEVICAELWYNAYAIGAARQKTIIDGNIQEYIPLRVALAIIDNEQWYYGFTGRVKLARVLHKIKKRIESWRGERE